MGQLLKVRTRKQFQHSMLDTLEGEIGVMVWIFKGKSTY